MAHSSPLALGYDRVPIWESAFKIAEAPMSYLNKLHHGHCIETGSCLPEFFKTLPTSVNEHVCGVFEGLGNRSFRVIQTNFSGLGSDIGAFFIHLYEKKHLLVISLATGVAYPITLVAIPFSIIADIFAGVLQASLRLYQGADRGEISSILHKKVIASPVQQTVYLLTGIAILGILLGYASLKARADGVKFIDFSSPREIFLASSSVSFVLGHGFYFASQHVVARLPRFFRPDGYNIFIEGGAESSPWFGKKADFDPESDYQKWRNQKSNQGSSGPSSPNESSNEELYLKLTAKGIRDKYRQEISLITPSSESQFKEFKDWFHATNPTYALFGFSSRNDVTEDALRRKYNPLAFKCHPDKFPENRAEAEIWFKLLQEARFDVETNVLKIDKSVSQE